MVSYQTSSQLSTHQHNEGEVDASVAGAGDGVSNPMELVESNTSIDRYAAGVKSNISFDASTNETTAPLG